jgi:hypothetical protein
VNVYALGIYVDDAACVKALAPKHKGKAAATLAKDAALFAGALCERGVVCVWVSSSGGRGCFVRRCSAVERASGNERRASGV